MKNDQKKFGKRICVIGSSCAGKSTLSEKLAEKLNYPILHLDQIIFIPGTNWLLGSHEEAQKIHDEFLKKKEWIIDGQCKSMMPQRLNRADILIWIKVNRFICLWRFFKRCRIKGERPGGLKNASKEFSWRTIWQIIYNQPKSQKKITKIIECSPHLKVIILHSFKDMDSFLKTISGHANS